MATGEYYGFDNLKSTNNLDKLDEIVRLFLDYADPSIKGSKKGITSSWGFYCDLFNAFESFKLHFENYSIGISQEDLSKKIQYLIKYISSISGHFVGYDSSTAKDYLNKMGIDIDFFFNNTGKLIGQKDKNCNWAKYSYIDNENDGVDYNILDLHRSFFSLISEHFVNELSIELSRHSFKNDIKTESNSKPLWDQKHNKLIALLVENLTDDKFIEEKSYHITSFYKFFNRGEINAAEMIYWKNNPTTLAYLIKTINGIVNFKKFEWCYVNSYFVAYANKGNIYDFIKAGNNLSNPTKTENIKKIDMIINNLFNS